MNFEFSLLRNGSRCDDDAAQQLALAAGERQRDLAALGEEARPLAAVVERDVCGLIGSICHAPSTRSLYVWICPFGTRTVSAQMPLGSPRNSDGAQRDRLVELA